ncbi:MAG: Uncharacterized protein K0S09_1305 [Sphingobacteriaceae bacterium]|jgi:hypothetical protein|nr:Uncharacterized protein [Sphingobacteriaceae bacterium]
MKARAVVCLIMFSISFSGFGQEVRPGQYLSINLQPFSGVSNKVVNPPGRSYIQTSHLPGASFGLNYLKLYANSLAFTTGLNYQITPVGFKYDIEKQDFDLPASYTGMYHERIDDYSVGQVFVPIRLGYFLKGRKWNPNVFAGVNAMFITSYELEYSVTTIDDQNTPHPLFSSYLHSAQHEPKLGLTYNASINLSRVLKKGNLLSVGLTANLSSATITEGDLYLYLKNGVESSTYSDKGSYLGLNFSYSFATKKSSLTTPPVRENAVQKTKSSSTMVYAEFLGAGLGFTANLDQRFKKDQSSGLGFRVGAGFVASYLNLPIGINYVGTGRRALEAGVGYIQMVNLDPTNGDQKLKSIGTTTLGIRFKPVAKGFGFRVNWDPFYTGNGMQPLFFGGSVGFYF